MSWRDKIAAVLAGKVGGPTPTGIHAYHSSPHDFDRFENKLLTGEGANVYGAGTYLAENPAVSGQGGQYWKAFANRFGKSSGENTATEYLARAGFDREKAMQTLQHALDNPPEYTSGYNKMTQERMRQDALRILASGERVGPRTYEVNFRAKPEELLDWDKPLAQMSPEVQERLQKAWLAHPEGHSKQTGGQIYESSRLVRGDYRDPAAASKKLADAGIPGIRYLDEGSRGIDRKRADLQRDLEWAHSNLRVTQPEVVANLEGQIAALKPTHNYVAFDPSRLDIMAKYGVVGGVPLGAGAMGGTIDQSTYGARQ